METLRLNQVWQCNDIAGLNLKKQMKIGRWDKFGMGSSNLPFYLLLLTLLYPNFPLKSF